MPKTFPPKNKPEEVHILRALSVVSRHVEKVLEAHERHLQGKPLGGWSQEKHDAYHNGYIARLNLVLKELHTLEMKIDPD